MSDSPMQILFSRLKPLGVTQSFARKALPQWWDDSIAVSEAGLQQAHLFIAKAFNLDIQSFDTPQIQFREVQRRFKLSKNVDGEAVNLSAHYATGIAKIALQAVVQQVSVPKDALELRSQCLVSGKGVGLNALLAWCANANIPVLHISTLPGKKMTGLVVREDNKFAIVLSKKGCESEMLFWLAHELGHIACGHLKQDGFFADESIGHDLLDEEERQADAFGIVLLNGSDTKYVVSAKVRALELAKAAVEFGKKKDVDAGHILLNYGHNNQRFYGLAKAALKELKQSSETASKTVNEKVLSWLSEEMLSEDQLDLLQSACGIDNATLTGA